MIVEEFDVADDRKGKLDQESKIPTYFLLILLPTILISFSRFSTVFVVTDLIVYKTCLVSMNLTETECLMLRENSSTPKAMELEKRVERDASVLVMGQSLIDSALPAVVSLFVGSWSDRAGRRPLFLALGIGFTCEFLLLTSMSNWNISPWYLLLALIPANAAGGLCTWTIAATCYLTDKSPENKRLTLLGLLEATTCVGDFSGIFLGPLIYKNYGYTILFATASITAALALIFTYFLVPESLENASEESISGLFKVRSLLKDLVSSLTSKRDCFGREIVWIAIFISTITNMVMRENITIGFLFTRTRLGWDVGMYSYFIAASAFSRIAGLCLVSLLNPVLGLSDTLVSFVALASGFSASATKSLTWLDWHLFLAVSMDRFVGAVGPAMRSIISKSVPAKDVSKIISFITFLQKSSSMIGAPIYMLVYTNYISSYPSPAYLLSTLFYSICIFFAGWLTILLNKSRGSFVDEKKRDFESDDSESDGL